MSESPFSKNEQACEADPGDGRPRPFGWAARVHGEDAVSMPDRMQATSYSPPIPNPYSAAPQGLSHLPAAGQLGQGSTVSQSGSGLLTSQFGLAPESRHVPYQSVVPAPGDGARWISNDQTSHRGRAILAILLTICLGVFAAGITLISTGVGKPAREPRVLLEGDVDRLTSDLQSSVVSVGGKTCSYISSGSGFFVSHDLVATNAHVVAGMKEPEIRTNSNVSFSARPVVFDPDNDVAILEIDSPDRIPMSLADYEPPEGEGVVALGFPEAGPYNASPGKVTLILDAQGESIYGSPTSRQKHIILDIQVRPGNSGGPVVDRDGAVLGIVTAKSVISRTNGIAVPAATIRRHLEKLNSSRTQRNAVGTGSCLAH